MSFYDKQTENLYYSVLSSDCRKEHIAEVFIKDTEKIGHYSGYLPTLL